MAKPAAASLESCSDIDDLLRLFVSVLDVGDETPPLVVVHQRHETTGLIDDVLFCLTLLWSATLPYSSGFLRNKILVVPLRIARDTLPFDAHFIAEDCPNDPARGRPIAQAYLFTYFKRVRPCVRLILDWGSPAALHKVLFYRHVILMVPLRIASHTVPCDTNFTA